MGDYASGPAGDYTSRNALNIRADNSLRKGDKYVDSTKILTVKYALLFDEFAAAVAYELRFKLVYRTDGGRIARGLVRSSQELQVIHRAYWGAHTKPGAPIRLQAHIFRRRDPVATERWVMHIRFVAPDWNFVDENDPIQITANDVNIAKARCDVLDRMLSCVHQSAQTPRFKNDVRTKRILKMIKVAEDAGCEDAKKLWYYNRAVGFKYFTWRTTEPERKRMTTATNGKMPFDGDTFPHGQWRLYPFQQLISEFGARDLTTCDGAIWNRMVFFEDAIASLFDDINRELNIAGPLIDLLNQMPKGASSAYGSGEAFLEHLVRLQSDPKHLYSAFK